MIAVVVRIRIAAVPGSRIHVVRQELSAAGGSDTGADGRRLWCAAVKIVVRLETDGPILSIAYPGIFVERFRTRHLSRGAGIQDRWNTTLEVKVGGSGIEVAVSVDRAVDSKRG